jgi:hypothetical protein
MLTYLASETTTVSCSNHMPNLVFNRNFCVNSRYYLRTSNTLKQKKRKNKQSQRKFKDTFVQTPCWPPSKKCQKYKSKNQTVLASDAHQNKIALAWARGFLHSMVHTVFVPSWFHEFAHCMHESRSPCFHVDALETTPYKVVPPKLKVGL